MDTFLLNYAGQIGQNALFLLIVGWLVMEVKAQKGKTEKMSVALANKQNKEMCDKIHLNLDKNFEDLKLASRDIKMGIDGLKDMMIKTGG